MIPSASCKNMIKGFEGYRDTAYKCVPTEKHWTIGYGHYGPDVQPGQKITREQGDAYFEADIAWCIAAVNKLSLPFQLNQNQFDALVSFAYNLGPKRLQDFRGKSASVIAAEIPLYCHCGKKVLPGLVRRRNAERDLFLSDPSLAELNRSISSVADEVIQGKWGNGAERKQRLTEAGYNYDEVQAEVNRKLKPPPPPPPKKSVSELADEVIQGRWGCGAERKQRLTEAGYNYDEVQAEVNRKLKPPPPPPPKKSVSELADEVIQGKWGNGAERKQRLTDAGYNYDEVQAEVNRKLKPSPPPPPKKSVSELADEVIRGRWGCGAERKRRLAEAGYDYSAVQAEVNRRLRRK